MAEENTGIIEPAMGVIQFSGKLVGDFSEIAKRLSQVQAISTLQDPDAVIAFRVEGKDIQKRPFLFYIMSFGKDGIKIDYTIPKDASENMRRLFVLRNFIGVLSLITDQYTVEQQSFLQYLDSSIDSVLGSISQNYSTLFNSYDSLLVDYRELHRQNIEVMNSNKNLTIQATRLNAENEDLKARLSQLETYSDDSLMVMVQEWVESHNDMIDINEFAKTYKLTPPRVEQILNKMVSLGYLEARG